jgi:hypothetical protein
MPQYRRLILPPECLVSHPLIPQFDEFIRRDPAQRGLIGSESRFGPLCAGHLERAAHSLATGARRVAIVTGFYIPRGDPPAAETDGPPGSLLLATALHRIGIHTEVITDAYCFPAVAVAAREMAFPAARLIEYPHPTNESGSGNNSSDENGRFGEVGKRDVNSDVTTRWRADYLRARPDLSHLIAVERAGPSHTLKSFEAQESVNPGVRERFEAQLPLESRDRCHNMRGEVIDEFTGDVHRLFEDVGVQAPHVQTIGVGDGANEIGMGAVPWEELSRRLSGEQAARVPCRIRCDWNIVAGTSNWGAYALAAAVLHLLDRAHELQGFNADQQERLLEAMVSEGPAVDGVTRRREATVDGIPFRTYIQPWEGIRRLLGLD